VDGGLAGGEGGLVAEAARPAGARAAVSAPAGVRVRRGVTLGGRALFILAVLAILFGPLLILVVFSFNDSTILSFPWAGFTTRWYRQAFEDPQLRTALLNSIVVSFIVAPLCLVIGTLTAFGLTRFRFRGRGAIAGLVGAPLVLPWLVIGIAALLAYRHQWVDLDLGLNTVVATQVICTFPLVTAIVAAQLFRFDRLQEEAAVDLGCSRLQVLRHVILPHIAPAVAAGAIFALTWSFNNFEISFFTIGFQQTFPIWVYSTVRDSEHLPVVNAISTVISVVQVLLIWAALKLMRARGGATAPGVDTRPARGAA